MPSTDWKYVWVNKKGKVCRSSSLPKHGTATIVPPFIHQNDDERVKRYLARTTRVFNILKEMVA